MEPQLLDAASPSKPDRNWAVLCHLSTLLILVVPGAGILAPLLLWLARRERSGFVDDEGREALNFAITLVLAAIACVPFMFILIGFVLLGVVYVYCFVFAIIAATHASRGEPYRYPLTLRLIS